MRSRQSPASAQGDDPPQLRLIEVDPAPPRPAAEPAPEGQLRLVAGASPRRRRPGRNAAMAERLDRAAQAADREARYATSRGDHTGARIAADRAADARRAARLLRAGPTGIRELLAS